MKTHAFRASDVLRFVVLALLFGAVSCTSTEPVADPCDGAQDVHQCRWDTQSFAAGHPCRLLRLSESEEILGVGLSFPGSKETLCFNVTDGGDEFEYAFTGGAPAVAEFDASTKNLDDSVDGLGVASRWDPERRTLHVSTGDGYLWLEMPPIPRARTAAVRLAEVALRRI